LFFSLPVTMPPAGRVILAVHFLFGGAHIVNIGVELIWPELD